MYRLLRCNENFTHRMNINSNVLIQKEEVMSRIQIQNLPNNSMQELKQKNYELDAVRGGCSNNDYLGIGVLRTNFTF